MGKGLKESSVCPGRGALSLPDLTPSSPHHRLYRFLCGQCSAVLVEGHWCHEVSLWWLVSVMKKAREAMEILGWTKGSTKNLS